MSDKYYLTHLLTLKNNKRLIDKLQLCYQVHELSPDIVRI